MEAFSFRHYIKDQWRHFPLIQHWHFDVLAICMLTMLQYGIFDKMMPNWIELDLLTPWAILYVIVASRSHLYLTLTSILILVESNTSLPFGLYSSSLIMILAILSAIKEKISWFNPYSWISTCIAAAITMRLMVLLTYQLDAPYFQLGISNMISVFVHIMAQGFMGYLLALIFIKKHQLQAYP